MFISIWLYLFVLPVYLVPPARFWRYVYLSLLLKTHKQQGYRQKGIVLFWPCWKLRLSFYFLPRSGQDMEENRPCLPWLFHYWHQEAVLLLDPKTFLITLVNTYKQYLQEDLLVYHLYEGSVWMNFTLKPGFSTFIHYSSFLEPPCLMPIDPDVLQAAVFLPNHFFFPKVSSLSPFPTRQAAIEICAKIPASTYWPASSSIFSSAHSSPLIPTSKHKHWSHLIIVSKLVYSCPSALGSNQKAPFAFLFFFLSLWATDSSFHYKWHQSKTEECCNWAWFYLFPQH